MSRDELSSRLAVLVKDQHPEFFSNETKDVWFEKYAQISDEEIRAEAALRGLDVKDLFSRAPLYGRFDILFHREVEIVEGNLHIYAGGLAEAEPLMDSATPEGQALVDGLKAQHDFVLDVGEKVVLLPSAPWVRAEAWGYSDFQGPARPYEVKRIMLASEARETLDRFYASCMKQIEG